MSDSVAPGTVACQAPLSKGFSRQEYWSGLPFPPSGDLPNSGINPVFPVPPALAGEPLYHWGTWKSQTPGGKNPLSTIHSAWWLQGMAPRATRLTKFLQLRCNHNITQPWVQTATYFKFTMYSALGEILYLYITLYRLSALFDFPEGNFHFCLIFYKFQALSIVLDHVGCFISIFLNLFSKQ